MIGKRSQPHRRLIFIYVRSNNYPGVIRFLSRGNDGITRAGGDSRSSGHTDQEEFTGDIPIPHTYGSFHFQFEMTQIWMLCHHCHSLPLSHEGPFMYGRMLCQRQYQNMQKIIIIFWTLLVWPRCCHGPCCIIHQRAPGPR